MDPYTKVSIFVCANFVRPNLLEDFSHFRQFFQVMASHGRKRKLHALISTCALLVVLCFLLLSLHFLWFIITWSNTPPGIMTYLSSLEPHLTKHTLSLLFKCRLKHFYGSSICSLEHIVNVRTFTKWNQGDTDRCKRPDSQLFHCVTAVVDQGSALCSC